MRLLSLSLIAQSMLLAAVLVNPIQAHVELDYPNGGEMFTEGETVTIEWHVVIQHNQLNWDLWYSTVGSSGPWTDIAMDLSPGSFSPGSVHTYGWDT